MSALQIFQKHVFWQEAWGRVIEVEIVQVCWVSDG